MIFFIDRSKIALRFECAYLEGPENELGGTGPPCKEGITICHTFFFLKIHKPIFVLDGRCTLINEYFGGWEAQISPKLASRYF